MMEKRVRKRKIYQQMTMLTLGYCDFKWRLTEKASTLSTLLCKLCVFRMSYNVTFEPIKKIWKYFLFIYFANIFLISWKAHMRNFSRICWFKLPTKAPKPVFKDYYFLLVILSISYVISAWLLNKSKLGFIYLHSFVALY